MCRARKFGGGASTFNVSRARSTSYDMQDVTQDVRLSQNAVFWMFRMDWFRFGTRTNG
jgi:hypothetical protein